MDSNKVHVAPPDNQMMATAVAQPMDQFQQQQAMQQQQYPQQQQFQQVSLFPPCLRESPKRKISYCQNLSVSSVLLPVLGLPNLMYPTLPLLFRPFQQKSSPGSTPSSKCSLNSRATLNSRSTPSRACRCSRATPPSSRACRCNRATPSRATPNRATPNRACRCSRCSPLRALKLRSFRLASRAGVCRPWAVASGRPDCSISARPGPCPASWPFVSAHVPLSPHATHAPRND